MVVVLCMRKVSGIKVILLSCAILISSCSGNDGCQDGQIEVMSLEDLGCTNTAFNVKVATLQEFELIRNQEDYDAFISADCNPQIDWLNYDMIAGMVGLNQGLRSIKNLLVTNCRTNRLILTVEIHLNLTQVAPQISFNAIIPKLKDEQDFFVEVKVKG